MLEPLVIRNLSKHFERPTGPVTVLDGLDLRVESGAFVHITGRSGSGKSTLLSLIAGLLVPDSGEVWIGDRSISALDEEERARVRNERIGVVPQQSTLLQSLTVLDNVVLPWFLYPSEGDAYGRARYLLDKLGIRSLEYALPHTLSGGEIRRVLIARALMNEPTLLLADEPTADLDPENTQEVLDLFRKLNQEDGVTLLVVTHELDTLTYGNQVQKLENGRFIPLAAPEAQGA